MIQKQVSIPANDTVDNLISGSIYEFLPWNAKIDAGMLQNSGTTGELVATVNSGSDTVLEESPLKASAGNFPTIPDDMFVQDVAAAGERLVFKVRNTTAGAIVVNLLVQLTPV
jgi:hypothetical protein